MTTIEQHARRPGPWRGRLTVLAARLTGPDDSARAGRAAGAVFLVRVASAAIVYLSQIILARWLGKAEFGSYIFVWTLTILIGDTVHAGLAFAAQRFIPEYTRQQAQDLLRGFLVGSRWLVLGCATVAAVLLAGIVRLSAPMIETTLLVPLYLACIGLPLYALTDLADGVARTYGWVYLALVPQYVLRPLLIVALVVAAPLLGFAPDAVTATTAAVVAIWIASLLQLGLLSARLSRTVAPGPRAYDVRHWLSVSLPICLVMALSTLFSYTDLLMLQVLRSSAEVAVYFAANKTLSLIAFINFSVVAAVAHRFVEHHGAGDRARLAELLAESIRWTFWPSLAAVAVLLALGWPVLALFGPGFTDGYPLLFILAIGLMARAAVGPAERLLNLLGEQRRCTAVYAVATAANVALCAALIPPFGTTGAAIAVTLAILVEAGLLFVTVKRRLGLHAFVFKVPTAPARAASPGGPAG